MIALVATGGLGCHSGMASEQLIQKRRERIQETHACRPGNCALLVIDMQHGFLDEGASLEVPKGRGLIPNIKRLIDAGRALGVPVIFTEFVYADNVPCLRGDPFGPQHMSATVGEGAGYGATPGNCLIGPNPGSGAESAATIPALQPLPGELVVQAHTYDKFYGTHLDLALRSQDIRRLIVTGVTTDVCVNSTIISGSTRDYRITAVTDGMATIHDHIQDACLQIWENKFARLRTTDEVLAELG
jgi:nicotinamidase-related amidase